MKGSKVAFTLVEILVVTTIIGVLAALLFPVLAEAKRSAKKADAISRARQLGTAQLLYLNDHDDSFVLYNSGSVVANYETGSGMWMLEISPYLGAKSEVARPWNIPLAEDLPKVFFDPNLPFKKQAGSPCQLGVVTSWGISEAVVDWYGTVDRPATQSSLTATSIESPSHFVLMAQTRDWMCNEGFPGSALALTPLENPFGFSAKDSTAAYYGAIKVPQTLGDPADPKGRNIVLTADGSARLVPAGELMSESSWWMPMSGRKDYR